MDRALETAAACHRFKILKAECLALLGRYPEAQSVARYGSCMTSLNTIDCVILCVVYKFWNCFKREAADIL